MATFRDGWKLIETRDYSRLSIPFTTISYKYHRQQLDLKGMKCVLIGSGNKLSPGNDLLNELRNDVL